MKKFIAIIFISIFIFSLPLLTSCANNTLPSINMSTYFKKEITASIITSNVTTSRTLDLSILTNSDSNHSRMDKYLDFKITANPSWIYKMYVEKIEFYVLTNQDTNDQFTITLNMSNLAKENNISNIESYNDTLSRDLKAYKAQKYTFVINQVVASSTGSVINIDISESNHLLISQNNQNNDFKWMVYDFKIYGESREYSR